MSGNTTDRHAFIAYPTNRVVGTIADADGARTAIEELLQAGFAREEIDILHGDDDLHRLDVTGTEHGFLARFHRTLLRTAGPVEEFKHLQHHIDDVRAGRYVIMVLSRTRAKRESAADILHAHGAEFVGFYGRWAWESMDVVTSAPIAYEVDLEGATTRFQLCSDGRAIVSASRERPLTATVTPIKSGVSLLSWQQPDGATSVQVHDFHAGSVYAVIRHHDGTLRHVRGALQR